MNFLGLLGFFGAANFFLNIFKSKSPEKIEEPFIIEDILNQEKKIFIRDALASLDSENFNDCKKEVAKMNRSNLPYIEKMEIFNRIGQEILMTNNADLISFLLGEFGIYLSALFTEEKSFQDYILNKATSVLETWWEESFEYRNGGAHLYILQTLNCLPFSSMGFISRIFQDVDNKSLSCTPEIEKEIQKLKSAIETK
jgi:hypothetical protein